MHTSLQQSPLITPSEIEDLVSRLRSVHDEVRHVISTLTLAQWNAKPSEGVWSPSEVVQHILLVEMGILNSVRNHVETPPSNDWYEQVAQKEPALRRFLPRGGKAVASEKNSTFREIEQQEALLMLQDSIGEYESFLLDERELPLKAILWPHSIFGPLSAYLWLLYIPLHSQRHVLQLRLAARMQH
jgi:uncharacterized damage-inducible protein DinB